MRFIAPQTALCLRFLPLPCDAATPHAALPQVFPRIRDIRHVSRAIAVAVAKAAEAEKLSTVVPEDGDWWAVCISVCVCVCPCVRVSVCPCVRVSVC
jgi:hypothetical protein